MHRPASGLLWSTMLTGFRLPRPVQKRSHSRIRPALINHAIGFRPALVKRAFAWVRVHRWGGTAGQKVAPLGSAVVGDGLSWSKCLSAGYDEPFRERLRGQLSCVLGIIVGLVGCSSTDLCQGHAQPRVQLTRRRTSARRLCPAGERFDQKAPGPMRLCPAGRQNDQQACRLGMALPSAQEMWPGGGAGPCLPVHLAWLVRPARGTRTIKSSVKVS